MGKNTALTAPGVSGAGVPPPLGTGSGQTARLLAALLVAATVGAWFVESRSPLAGRIRGLKPFAVWSAVLPRGGDAPLFFLSLHQPAKGSVDLLYIPAEYKLGPRETAASAYKRASPGGGVPAARAVCARLHDLLFTLPALAWLDLGQPRFIYEEPAAFPAGDPVVVMRRRLTAAHSGTAFWKRLPGLLRGPGADAVLVPGAVGPGAGDLPPRLRETAERLAYALELHRTSPRSIRPAWLPGETSLEPFLLRILGPEAGAPRPADQPVTVEVLNATVLKGIATDATKVIRLRGADVLHSGNAESTHPGTLVYDLTGRFENARRVREMLGCPSAEAVTRVRERTLVEVSVVVGEDCAGVGRREPQGASSQR
ncbi:MAG: LytR C-terminal domain-containing protein [Elusimicrobia bacterium]|nr:LytR C-terminal domain-containing protein [Elusimicrobiota bacterium]